MEKCCSSRGAHPLSLQHSPALALLQVEEFDSKQPRSSESALDQNCQMARSRAGQSLKRRSIEEIRDFCFVRICRRDQPEIPA